MENSSLESLLRLKQQVEMAISLLQSGSVLSMSRPEREEYRKKYGDADFVVGDFSIKEIQRLKFFSEL